MIRDGQVHFWRKGVLNEEAGKYFEEQELDFDISSRIRDLSELEKSDC